MLRKAYVPVLMGSRIDPTTQLLSKFEGAGDEVGIGTTINGTDVIFLVYQHLHDRMYWSIGFEAADTAVGAESMRMGGSQIKKLYLYHNQNTTPAMSFSGGWSSASDITYIGGISRYTNTTNNYIQLVTAAGATTIEAQGGGGGNCGLALVTIDGDKTLANALPTAQSLVDAGTYPNTILVANGGSLNPTDRVWDQYNTGVARVVFATGLSAASHTVRITVTGYKRAAASDKFILVTAILGYGSAYGNLASANLYLSQVEYVISAIIPSVWEISWGVIPTGGSTQQWIGHEYSEKCKIAPAVTVDGTSITPTNGVMVVGASSVIITMQHSVRHPDIGGGATEIGVLDMTYNINSRTGMTISHSLTWSLGGVIYGAFPCMMAVDSAIYDRVRYLGGPVELLTDNDNSFKAQTSNPLIYAWDYSGNQGALFYITDMLKTVNNWAENASAARLFWKDMAAPNAWEKAYAQKYSNPKPYSIGDKLESEANYRIQWFSGGANAALGA